MPKSKLVVAKNKVVGFHYTLTDDEGKTLDSSVGNDPLQYLHGHAQIVPGLESALEGKENGSKLVVKIPAKDGYGDYNPEMVFPMQKEQFGDSKDLKVGVMFELEDENGNALLVSVKEIGADAVTVDANHPLAGQNLNFSVEVMSIRDATADELAHKHAHSGSCC